MKVGYAPIEQYSKTAKQGPYTDMYAVAALFYRMLTGKKPAPANERVNEDTLVPPSTLGVSIPEQAEMAIMVCLNIYPEHRLQNASDFMEALDGIGFEPKYEPDWILPYQLMIEKKESKFTKLSAPVKGLILFGVLLIIAGGVFAASRVLTNKDSVEVGETSTSFMPDCVGKSSEEAIASLQEAGIPFNEKLTYEYNPDTEKGKVTSQNIRAGVIVQEEDVVNLTVSGGDSTFTMPDLSTMSRDDVKNFFESKGVPVTLEDTFSEEVPKDQMVLQSMAAGEDYTIGDASMPAITVAYSLGKKSDYDVKMPNLKNLSVKEAKKNLQDAGLTLEVSVEKDSDYNKVKKGKVCDQSISAGEKVNTIENKGDEVVLYTSIGPKPTPKPTQKPVVTSRPSSNSSSRSNTGNDQFSAINGSGSKRSSSASFATIN